MNRYYCFAFCVVLFLIIGLAKRPSVFIMNHGVNRSIWLSSTIIFLDLQL